MVKRPPSLSDSFIYLAERGTLEPLHVPLRDSVEVAIINAVDSAVAEEPKVDGVNRCEQGVEYVLRFLFHLTLISVFETVFFFLYVSRDEDGGILQATNYYTNAIIDSCAGLNVNESAAVNSLLAPYINGSSVIGEGAAATATRAATNNGLMRQSYLYIGGLGAAMVLVAAFGLYKGYRIAWLYIIGENLVFVTLLGLYEYMFFQTIIKRYSPESPAEISAGLVRGMQQQCGLLTG
jgi:hypothetical protein